MEIVFPRSPREVMAGWVYLPRFVDKIRLHLAGKLAPDYQQNFAYKGFDAKWCLTAGVAADDFIKMVGSTITDGEVCDWVDKHVNPGRERNRAFFNEHVLSFGRGGEPDVIARLKMRKEQAGFSDRDTVDTFAAFIDADEKRL